jgi:hypothetical protein
MRNFIGRGNFTWFVGVVEDINDPVELGRVRVRCFGWHTEDKGQIPTDMLPWAIPVNPVSSASDQGVGESPTGLLVGSWVVGFFIDGERAQEPMVLGSINSVQDGVIDTNQLAVGTQTKSYTPDSAIGEPDDPYNAQYPYNRVMETRSGHVKEFDDTPDSERIRELHKSGTFYQVHPDGTVSTHIVRDRYTVVANDDSIHVSGDVRMIIEGNWDVDVTGDVSIDARRIYLNRDNGDAWAAARLGDTADTGDDPPGISGSDGSNKIETGSGTVFIGK